MRKMNFFKVIRELLRIEEVICRYVSEHKYVALCWGLFKNKNAFDTTFLYIYIWLKCYLLCLFYHNRQCVLKPQDGSAVRPLASKSDNQHSIPRICMVEGENWFQQVVLFLFCVHYSMFTYTLCTPTHVE